MDLPYCCFFQEPAHILPLFFLTVLFGAASSPAAISAAFGVMPNESD
jgi:hypothetical protein